MRKYGKWVLTLGLMAAAPTVTNAEGFLGFKSRKSTPPVTARRTAPQQSQAGAKYNQQVAERIASALRDAKLNGYDVEIEYKDGIATLKGDIADPAQRAKALALVSKVPGVRQVSNQMKSRTARPAPPASAVRQVAAQRPAAAPQSKAAVASNQQLANNLAKSLSSAGLSGYDVKIRVENGLATLAGSVGSEQQVAQAAHVAKSVQGITRVNNKLNVVAPTRAQAPRQNSRVAQIPTAPRQGGQRVAPVAYQAPPNGSPIGAHPQRMAALPAGMPSGGMGGMSTGGYIDSGVPMADGAVYDQPYVPDYAWPSYASYPNYSAVSYPTEYSPSAFPYIGPFYPYPQVPLGWRKAQLEWDDGSWNLSFNSKTDKWFWFMNPKNWK